MFGSSQSNDSNGRALPDLPQLDPNRIRFAHRNSLAGILYVLAIPASLLVFWFFTALLVNFLDSPGRYAPNGTVAGAGGVLSGAIKVCFFAGVVLISGFLWRHVKASFQTSSDERILSDARLPVLYLRPFGADSKFGFLHQAPRAEMTSFR